MAGSTYPIRYPTALAMGIPHDCLSPMSLSASFRPGAAGDQIDGRPPYNAIGTLVDDAGLGGPLSA